MLFSHKSLHYLNEKVKENSENLMFIINITFGSTLGQNRRLQASKADSKIRPSARKLLRNPRRKQLNGLNSDTERDRI